MEHGYVVTCSHFTVQKWPHSLLETIMIQNRAILHASHGSRFDRWNRKCSKKTCGNLTKFAPWIPASSHFAFGSSLRESWRDRMRTALAICLVFLDFFPSRIMRINLFGTYIQFLKASNSSIYEKSWSVHLELTLHLTFFLTQQSWRRRGIHTRGWPQFSTSSRRICMQACIYFD